MAGRISSTQIFDLAQRDVARARERQMISAEKAATGREMVRPSQDPAGYMVSNSLKDDMSSMNAVLKNASSAQKVLEMTETVFASVQESMQRAYELAVAAANVAGGDSVRKFNLSEVETLYDGVIQALNARYGSRTLLGGFKDDRPAFDKAGNFLGDGGQIEIEIARGLKMPLNVSGERAVLGIGIHNGMNILGPLQLLLTGLREGNTEVIQSSLENFGKVNDQISLIRGEIGSRTAQIGRAIASQQQIGVDSLAAVSEIEDADAVKVFSDLSRDQAVLNAAIATTNKILSENPTDIFYK